MELGSLKCSAKYKQDGKISVHFHSVEKESIAVHVMPEEQAKDYQIGRYYEFSAKEQERRMAK